MPVRAAGLAEPRIGIPVCSGGFMAAAGSPGSGGSIDLGLRGSTVVVTGAGSGIGAAAARLLGAAGASVVLVGRRGALLRQCADAIGQAGGRAFCVPADLADPASPARIISSAHEADQVPLGRIGNADEVARWIALLLSPVSSFMTGAVIPLDGGQVIPGA
jgi:NAD(P)-dependent dehydrogenase (short-subunit alcohol dehydrogenase family)